MPHVIGKIGQVWAQLDRSPCPACGGTKYTVITSYAEHSGLMLRCSLCARLRGAVKDIGACGERQSHVW